MIIERENITAITLLSIDEYLESQALIPQITSWWWLRTGGEHNNNAAYVFSDGDVYSDGYFVFKTAGVRPAFVLDFAVSADLNPGDTVQIGKYTATVIYNDMCLLNDIACKHIFDPVSNNWRHSEIKTFVESEEFAKMIFGEY